jgi:hypothetical protein
MKKTFIFKNILALCFYKTDAYFSTRGDIRTVLQPLSPSGKMKPGLERSIKSIVKIQKNKSFSAMTGGMLVTNSFASTAALGELLWFGDIQLKQDSSGKHFSYPHEVFCIGYVAPEAAGEEIFFNVATAPSILILGRDSHRDCQKHGAGMNSASLASTR